MRILLLILISIIAGVAAGFGVFFVAQFTLQPLFDALRTEFTIASIGIGAITTITIIYRGLGLRPWESR